MKHHRLLRGHQCQHGMRLMNNRWLLRYSSGFLQHITLFSSSLIPCLFGPDSTSTADKMQQSNTKSPSATSNQTHHVVIHDGAVSSLLLTFVPMFFFPESTGGSDFLRILHYFCTYVSRDQKLCVVATQGKLFSSFLT